MDGTLPNFLIIGAQEAATRWLILNLGEHPDVYATPRELEFFNHHFERGPWWYAKQFRESRGQRAAGEATPGYMMWSEGPPELAARIDGLLPDARLFALLRNPIDRALSAFMHQKERGRIPQSTRIMDHVRTVPAERDPLSIVSGGWYGRSLKPYVERFGSRLCVLLHEDVQERPTELYSRACRHLAIDDRFVPPDLRRVRVSQPPPNQESRLSKAEREELYSFFVDDLRILSQVTAIDPERLVHSTKHSIGSRSPE